MYQINLNWISVHSDADVTVGFDKNHPTMILDATYSRQFAYIIAREAKSRHIFHLMFGEFEIPFSTEWTYPAAVSNQNMAYATYQVMTHFGWSATAVAVTPNDLGEKTGDLLTMVGMQIKTHIYLSEQYSSVHSRVSRIVKPSGVRVITAAVATGIEAKNLLKATYQKNIAGPGYGFVISGHGAEYVENLTELDKEDVLWTGPIFIVETGTETAGSIEEYIALITKLHLDRAISVAYMTGHLQLRTAETLKNQMLAWYWFDGEIIPAFSILNAQDGQLKTVGDITFGVLSITDTIIWPGSVTANPENTNANILFTYCGGDIDGDLQQQIWMPLLQMGFNIAYMIINLNPFIVANFNLYAQSIGCGLTVLN